MRLAAIDPRVGANSSRASRYFHMSLGKMSFYRFCENNLTPYSSRYLRTSLLTDTECAVNFLANVSETFCRFSPSNVFNSDINGSDGRIDVSVTQELD